jgi:hypothetical protein
MAKKTTCPISRKDFHAKAQPISVQIAGNTFTAPPREFSTGSLGWYINSKTTVDVGGVQVPVQIGLNITLLGSKELPKDGAHGEASHAGHAAAESPAGEDAATA